jgi:glutathione synthase
MRLSFVMAPPHLFPAEGRTVALLLFEAHRRGHRLWCIPPGTIEWQESHLVGYGYEADFPPTGDLGTFWKRLQIRSSSRPPVRVELDGMDAVVWRKDPPLYRPAAHSLVPLAEEIPCLNDPRALIQWSSKATAWERLSELMPPSVVVRSLRELKRASGSIPGPVVVKPLEGCKGEGVIRVPAWDRPSLEERVLVEPLLARSLTQGPGVLIQQEVQGHAGGDVRILCLGGRLLGAMRRIPTRGEFRSNVARGGRVAPMELSPQARSRWEALAAQLAKEGLFFVALDVIGEWLIEVNVVSPGGIPRLNSLLGCRLERRILEWLELRAKGASSWS